MSTNRKISNLPSTVAASIIDSDILPIVVAGVTSKVAVSELRIKLGTNPPAGGRTVTDAATYLLNNAVFNVLDYGAIGDNSHNDTTAVTNAIAQMTNGGTLLFPEGHTFKLNALTINKANVVVLIPAGVVLNFFSLGTGVNGFTVTADNCAFVGQGKLLGPSSGVYVQDERGISVVGSSSSSRRIGLRIDGLEITNFGSHGVYAQFLNRIDIPHAYLHNCGYAGAMFLSCDMGRVGPRVRIEVITPGTGANMYGISLTHDSTNYSSDPNAGTPLATNPFCVNWVLDGLFVNDLAWEGIDCHGGYDITVVNCKVYNTKQGITIPSGSGAAANYAGYKNVIRGCTIDARKPDGTVSGRENLGYGINVGGGSTVSNQDVLVIGNILVAKGVVSSATIGSILGEFTKGAIFQSNILRLWGGIGIYLGASADASLVLDNVFKELANAGDTAALAIRHTGTTQRITVRGNVLTANGGTAARVGLDIVNMTARPQIDDNDFKAATSSEYQFNTSPGLVNGTNNPVVVSMTVSGAAVDVTAAAGGTEIILLINVSSGAFTLDTITGAKSGQVITIINIGTSTVTLSRSSSALLGSATAVIPQKSTVRLVRIANTNYEIARSLTNG